VQDPVKESAGHAEVERYVSEMEDIELSSFRPQYMVGDGNNKDCEEYFFDRIVRALEWWWQWLLKKRLTLP
jgi:hypothetical protein